MIYLFVIALVGLMAMVLVSLLRGLNAFRQDLDAEKFTGAGPSPLQLQQNSMMWSRIKYQGLAVLVVAVLGMAMR